MAENQEPNTATGVTDEMIEEEIQAHAVARLFRPVRRLYEWVLGWAETRHAGKAMAALAFSEAIFFPVPADLLLGALCLGRPRRSFRWATICTLFSILGGTTAMLLGVAVAVAALTPVPYMVFSWVAGFADIGVWQFVVASVIFRSGRFFGVAAIVYVFGPAAKRFIDRYFNLVTVLVMLVVIAVVVLVKVLRG